MTTPYMPANVIDAAFDEIEKATHLHLVEGASIPESRSDVTTNTVGNVALAGAGADFTKSGVSGGRRLTLASKEDAAITKTSTTANWFALIDGTDLLYAKQVSGAPLSVTDATTRDFDFGYVEMLFAGTNV